MVVEYLLLVLHKPSSRIMGLTGQTATLHDISIQNNTKTFTN